jgi:hypothetical protein
VGKTVESYRMTLESEISRWSGFTKALRKSDREAFDELMDMCRSFASAGGNSTPVFKLYANCGLCNLSYLVCDFNKHVVYWGTCSHWVPHRDNE